MGMRIETGEINEGKMEGVLGKTTKMGVEDGHLWNELETEGNENSQKLMRVTLAKTSGNRGYRA